MDVAENKTRNCIQIQKFRKKLSTIQIPNQDSKIDKEFGNFRSVFCVVERKEKSTIFKKLKNKTTNWKTYIFEWKKIRTNGFWRKTAKHWNFERFLNNERRRRKKDSKFQSNLKISNEFF